ncbi:MAG: hypothetical protein IJD80_02890, partial [Oscillospiraceae bacterium]|nr:hypothetical protein [Oscillospiraceae bacterium]
PLYLKRIHNADMWLETRAIDSHRANSRLLKKALRLAEKDDVSTVVHVNAATITDNYWIRSIGSELTYEDVKFDNDYFSNLALRGTIDSFNRAANSKRSRTPELTNTGSFEKCWKLKDGSWWMYKTANHSETFSELFIYHLGVLLDMNMAVYERGEKCVKSLDFTGGTVNFEPASTFMGDNEDYSDVVKALQTLCPAAIPDYIKMIFLDTIVANVDRHTNNFGLLRDIQTGRLTGLAPNFDNNIALIARGYPSLPKKSDMLIILFNELMEEYPQYREFIPYVDEKIIRKTLDKVNMKVKSKEIISLIMARYNLIEK